MRIIEIIPNPNHVLTIVSEDRRIGEFDVSPYLQFEAFKPLQAIAEFMKVTNGGYFIEWECGADLSVDTIEAHWKISGSVSSKSLA